MIEIQDLGREYRGQWGVRHVTASVASGQVYAVLGANGAGKSTLLSLLAGWQSASEGKILLSGAVLRPTATHLRRQIMLLDDGISSTDRASRFVAPLRELAALIDDYRADRTGIENEVANWFERFGLVPGYKTPRESMSKGQAYKVRLIGLFVISPAVWLLDEPFSTGLDAEGILWLEQKIRRHVGKGGIVLFSTQWPQHARRLADRVIILHQGEMVWTGPIGAQFADELLAELPVALRAILMGLGDDAF